MKLPGGTDDLPSHPVLRREGIALWRQIAGHLQRDIDTGALPPGARLPTEAELSRHFGVNRHTVRRALEELSRGGVVRVEQGRGSFVAEDVLDYAVEPRTRFSEWIRRHNKEPSGRMLQLKETTADARVAAGLGLRAGARVVLLERLGFADDRPVSLTSHYFPAGRLPGLLDALRAAPRITEALRRSACPTTCASSPASPPGCRPRRRPTCCAPAAAGRCWWRRTSMSITTARWWNSPWVCIRPRACRSCSNHRERQDGQAAHHRRTRAAPGGEAGADVLVEDGRIAALDAGGGGPALDARGLLVLPGIVDIHGDAFERQIQPRPGVDFPPGSVWRTPRRSCSPTGLPPPSMA